MATVKLILRKDRANKQGEAPLYLRIIKDRKVKYISLNLRITPKYWDDSQCKVKANYKNANRINAFLQSKLADALKVSLELREEDKNTRTEDIKESLLGKASPNFFDYAYDFIRREYLNKGKSRTYKGFRTALHKMEEYISKPDFKIEEITVLFLKKYDNYLRTKIGNRNNTVYADLKSIRRILNEAVEDEKLAYEKNPFNRYKLKWDKVEKVYLTEQELKSVETLELTPGTRRDLFRDAFVFSAYAGGLRVSDVCRLKWSHYTGTHIIISTLKTNSTVSIKLPYKALEIIQKYQTSDDKPSDFIFPILDFENVDLSNPVILREKIGTRNAYANKELKAIAKKLGIEKNISFHTSRHTWATRALRKGMRIEYVSKLMGHANIKTTQVYAKIVNEELDKAMDVFND